MGGDGVNARIDWYDHEGAAAPATHELSCALRRVIASPAFAKAPRMCNMLSFLVQKKLGGEEDALTEYAIGMQLFRRDPASYDTTIDPVVRVQMGRLRTRLANYYGAIDDPGAPQICIPAGSYVPDLRVGETGTFKSAGIRLELASLRCLSLDARDGAFAAGVDEELCARMFLHVPELVQVRDRSGLQVGPDRAVGDLQQRLEGSIRIDQLQVRASMRLIDDSAGHIAWSTQIDCTGELGIALQEQLANAICAKLADHWRTNGAPIDDR
jgi:TolB-like protein